MIAFEKLSMNSSSGGGCALSATFEQFVCPVLIPEWGETVFASNTCDWYNDDGKICYHVPTISTNIFGS